MKKILIIAITLVLCGFFPFFGPIQDVMAGSMDGGGIEAGVASTMFSNSKPETEPSWVNSVLPGPDYYHMNTDNNPAGTDYRNVLFANNDIMSWEFVQLSTRNYIKYMGAISNVGEADGEKEVSESGTMLLIGIGLVCLGFFGKRKFGK